MGTAVTSLLLLSVTLWDHCVVSYKQDFFTPSDDNYYLMADYGISVAGKNTFLFEVQACSNVHILLMKNNQDFDDGIFEIILGEKENAQSAIRKSRQGDNVANVTHKALNCNKLQEFGISWANNTLNVGSVEVLRLHIFLSYYDKSLQLVRFFSISTRNDSSGHWVFDSSDVTTECCSYEGRDCQDMLDLGFTESGVYSVTPAGTNTSFEVYCDMDTGSGGWLVFQRRLDGSENFYRKWLDYKTGFGNPLREYWLGNDHLHDIVSQGQYELRIELEDFEGNFRYANYASFYIGDSSEQYKLTVGEYSGDAGDSMQVHQGRGFSTKDEGQSSNCAVQFKGAWWYKSCHRSNLNGLYLHGSHTSYADGVNWYSWKGYNYSLKRTEMKVKRK